MLDLNRIIGIVISIDNKQSWKDVRSFLVSLIDKIESDDLMIIGNKVVHGKGEITSLIANYKIPTKSESRIRALRDVVKSIGELDCNCTKMVLVIGDKFDMDFMFHYNKLMKISENQHYQTQYYMYNLNDYINNIENFKTQVLDLFKNETCELDVPTSISVEWSEPPVVLCNGENNAG